MVPKTREFIFQVDVWSRGGSFCQVHIKASNLKSLHDFCEQENITMNVDVPDLKDAIDTEADLNGLPTNDGEFNYTRYNNFGDVSIHIG